MKVDLDPQNIPFICDSVFLINNHLTSSVVKIHKKSDCIIKHENYDKDISKIPAGSTLIMRLYACAVAQTARAIWWTFGRSNYANSRLFFLDCPSVNKALTVWSALETGGRSQRSVRFIRRCCLSMVLVAHVRNLFPSVSKARRFPARQLAF